MEYNKLFFTGDPILDIYIDQYNSMRYCKGGALNIFQNCLALLEDFIATNHNDFIFGYPNDDEIVYGDIFSFYTIVRTPKHPDGIPLVSSDEKTIFYDSSGIIELINEFRPNILILGDYNKGTLTDFSDLDLPPIDICIVDSRYRSLDLRWINTSELKIWHATGEEYDLEWGKHFNYTFWSDGVKPVKILKNNEIISELSVPTETNIIDTCGAGDTFVATITACLYKYKDSSEEALINYAKYAIEVCQDVISKPFTSTTIKRIKR